MMGIRLKYVSVAVSLLAAMWAVGAAETAKPGTPLRMVVGTMSYPFEQYDEKNRLVGGLLKDFGEHVAKELGARAEFVAVPRKRVELALISGELDMSCYSSPNWSEQPKALLWSVPSLAQVERAVVLATAKPPERTPDDFSGKRVSLRLGYTYSAIQPLFDAGKATRIDETQVPLMFKAVSTGLTDVLISSEGEIEGYFGINPEARKKFAIATKPFSVVKTQCAVSPKSPWSLDKIDKALNAMMKRGDVERISKRYGMSMH